jgi:hypothetical protein
MDFLMLSMQGWNFSCHVCIRELPPGGFFLDLLEIGATVWSSSGLELATNVGLWATGLKGVSLARMPT